MPERLSVNRVSRGFAPRRRDQDGDCARREASQERVGPARQNDRNARSEHNAGGIRIGEKGEALCEHVAGLEIWNDEHVRASRDRVYLLDRRRPCTDCVVERERPVEKRPPRGEASVARRASAHSVADVHQTPADVVTVAVVSSAIHPAAVVVAVTGAVIWIPIPITIVGIRGSRDEERASRQTPPPPLISATAPPAAIIVPAIPAAIAAIAPARVSPTAAIAAAMPTAAPAAAAEAAHAAVKAPETA